jgi:hypothetical protein
VLYRERLQSDGVQVPCAQRRGLARSHSIAKRDCGQFRCTHALQQPSRIGSPPAATWHATSSGRGAPRNASTLSPGARALGTAAPASSPASGNDCRLTTRRWRLQKTRWCLNVHTARCTSSGYVGGMLRKKCVLFATCQCCTRSCNFSGFGHEQRHCVLLEQPTPVCGHGLELALRFGTCSKECRLWMC